MRELVASLGGKHNAKIKKIWRGTWAKFVTDLLATIPETMDKSSAGWICAAEFNPDETGHTPGKPYRDSENFLARHFLTFDYDHIAVDDVERVVGVAGPGAAFLAYTTWSHTRDRPRIRVWIPLSRPASYDEFQAVSRAVASRAGIELAARESHVPSQYMYRPAVKPFEEFQSWQNTEGPWADVDKILGEYNDWTDRKQWPHRSEGDGVHSEGSGVDPRGKPGIVGAFCRAFSISAAIDRFDLPYSRAGTEGRWTYTGGSRPEGAIVYDDDTKLHSHHDTDPARGQSNAYDLVRLHQFGWLDEGTTVPLHERASSRGMARMAGALAEVKAELPRSDAEFDDLDALESAVSTTLERRSKLPAKIVAPTSRLSDIENARRIQRQYGKKLISVGSTFFHWTGKFWEADDEKGFHYSINLSNIVRAEREKLLEKLTREGPLTEDDKGRLEAYEKWAAKCSNKPTISACTEILRNELKFDVQLLNAEPLLFSCESGTIDLRTSTLMEHDPLHFITGCAPTVYAPEAEAPRFLQFLHEIYSGQQDVVDFMQRWLGYCLTGSVINHNVVFHIGEGRNGKGTLMRVMRHVLGTSYYGTSNEQLLSYAGKGASPELAGLLGKRMVTVSETDAQLEIKEGILKSITGGDPINARDLYKSYMEFNPTHKLQIFTNNEPNIKTVDVAISERVILLRYQNEYLDPDRVAEERAGGRTDVFVKDRNLEKTLFAEAPGILKWLVDGARIWYERDLEVPPSLRRATTEYLHGQNLMAQFAAERLVPDPESWLSLSTAYRSYTGWCREQGPRPVHRPRFGRELTRVIVGAQLEVRDRLQGFTGFKLREDVILD